MTVELAFIIIEKALKYGVPVVNSYIQSLDHEPTIEDIQALGITKNPEDYFEKGD
ncbi:MAG: hypothetical protein PVI90_18665 [Desulfobacteraceae bacterium]|jgi:hypothetical protein